MEPLNCSIIGSGNVATHLAKRLFAKECHIVQIYSRTLKHAQILAQQVNAPATDNLQQLLPADLYIISVSDSAIPGIVEQMDGGNALVVHTSGSTNINTLEKFANHGVLYPLQTFSISKITLDWSEIPVFVEANNKESLEQLEKWALLLSPKVQQADSAARLQLHTSAVFACNFVNYLLGVAADLSGKNFPLLHPLIRETIEKAFVSGNPHTVQTGPAVRNDLLTMEKQIAILSPELQELYKLISKQILKSVNL